MFLTALGGFFMALADSVPGVSGGTVAFIMGFYDDFIGSIERLFYGKAPEKKKAVIFLLKLGTGLGHRHGAGCRRAERDV